MKTIALIALAWSAALPAAAQDALAAAKNLYATAAYEEALSTLTRAGENKNPAPDLVRQMDTYRAFCLYALGRGEEGDRVVESLIRTDPSMQLNANEASPRLAARFGEVRKRLLPSLIRDAYRAGKSALDARNYSEAEPHLARARGLLIDAEQLGTADAAMADLRMLVDGFLELAHGAASRPAVAENRTPPPPVVAARMDPAPAPTTEPERPSTVADEDVVPPVTLVQTVPVAPAVLAAVLRASRAQGIIDVVINESGAVEDAIIRRSINTAYDQMLLDAAHGWKYRPATKSGIPVRYTKTIFVRTQ